MVDLVRAGIREQESGGNYKANNPSSAGGKGAWGAYQYIDTTWAGRYGVLHASDATPEQQDAAANLDLTDLYVLLGDWDRVIVAWFQGPKVAAADKSTWTVKLQPYNPTPQEYLDKVLAHIKEMQ